MRQEKQQVIIDLKLPSNEVMHFSSEQIVMSDRSQLKGILDNLNQSGAANSSRSPFAKRG